MTGLPADQAARERITTAGLSQTLFVEAGAGSGKTTQLVERVVNLVLDDRATLSQIAAITFTEAAAGELRDRIRVEFEKVAADPTCDEVARSRARQAIADADLAAITTLHGFAKRILSEHPTAAQLPPRVDILDEINSQLEVEARWARFVDRLHAMPELEELIIRARLVGVDLEPSYIGATSMKDVAAVLTDNWDRLGSLLDSRPAELQPIDFTPFDSAVDRLEAHLPTCTDPTDKLYEHLLRLLPEMRAASAIGDPHLKLGFLRAQANKPVGKWGPGGGGKAGNWAGDAASVKECVKEVNAAIDEVLAPIVEDVLRHLGQIVATEVHDAARQRQAEGTLEFHDLLVLSREMLRTSRSARQLLHDRYTHLLLDEFQDTDPIQIEVAVLIAASIDSTEPGGETPTWSDAAIAEGRLFFVGDPKQSIYRFRRADIGLFLDARERFGADGSLLELSTNFRTVEPVVEFVNELFGQLMSEGEARAQPTYRPLSAFRSTDSGHDHRPVLLGGAAEGMKAAELREQEAADVVATIVDIRDHPHRWPVFENKAWREAQLRDITILVPTRTSLPQLREALDGATIPYRIDTGTLVYGTQEIRDLLAAVRAIDDPTDELSLVAALRSPFFACSDRDLFAWRHAGGRWNINASHPSSIDPNHPVALAFNRLHALWKERRWIGPSQLVDRLISDCRGDLLAFAEGRPRDVWRRLRFFVDQARSFEDSGGSGLRAFVAWAELQSAEGARVHEPLLPETDETAVRIMTIHGSKGLEFPITIVSGLTTQQGGARRGISVLWGDDDVPSLSMKKGVATANHDPRADLEASMDAHEKLRLLYVALTRARDHLIVSCHHIEKKGSFGEHIARHMGASAAGRPLTDVLTDVLTDEPSELTDPPAVSATPPTSSAAPIDETVWLAERDAIRQLFTATIGGQEVPLVASATSIAASAAQTEPSDPDFEAEVAGDAERLGGVGDSAGGESGSEAGPDVDVAPATTHRRGRKGTQIGTAVHAVLELLDFANPSDLEALAERFSAEGDVSDASHQVQAMARSALGAPIIQTAATTTHHKEVYVAAPVGSRVIEGYIDLLIETPAGLIVVDYKTDTVTESTVADKVARYELQAAAYAVALEQSTGLEVIDCRFVFCRANGAIERSVPDLSEAKQRVRNFLDPQMNSAVS